MITGTVLLFGLLFGMQHALEADHLAAVATLVTREKDTRRVIRQGVFWGLGHSLTLLLFGGLVMVIGVVLSERWVHGLEGAVGVMLVLLGLDLLRRLWRERVHFHAHSHPRADAPAEAQAAAAATTDTTTHFHAHSHRGETAPHDRRQHRHEHHPLPLRALLVGMVHGLAGSAALVLLTLQQVRNPWVGLLYVVLFGLGSVLGMAALSWTVSLPMRLTATHLSRYHRALSATVALFSIGLGLRVVVSQWGA
ncbi:urease accessory protein [Methylibium sp.]|uniref:urease accessory protein n=1 Tax=Methylibium sp. TaxID=2067992 RepID=UPI003D095A2A